MRIVLYNTDTGGVMEWTFESEIMSHLFVPAIFETLGEIPAHEYSETRDFMLIGLDIAQINRMRVNIKMSPQNAGNKKFYDDMTFLLTCSGFIKKNKDTE